MRPMLLAGCLGCNQWSMKCQRHPITCLRKLSEIQPRLYLTCSVKGDIFEHARNAAYRQSAANIFQSSAAVLWSVINKLRVISFLLKYHICSSKQICEGMQLLINHVIYAYVYVHGHTFSHCVQLTIRCTSDMCRTHEKKKKKNLIKTQRDQVPLATRAL